MAVTPFDSALYHKLFADMDIARLFTESAEIRAMLVVEGALARAQAGLGMIPEDAARAIQKDAMEVVIDPRVLADATAANGVPVPALVARFRTEMQNSEVSQYVHWGATTQDIVDTALMLRLRQVIARLEVLLQGAIEGLAGLAAQHRDTPMAARTWGMAATPTSFGAVVAGWGLPLIRLYRRLREGKDRWLMVSLSGAAGTLSAMGPDGAEVRAELAGGLGLGDPAGSWHSTRDGVAEFAAWCTALSGSLGKMGEDVLSLTRSGEVVLAGGGGSSTMPQKANPVLPSLMVALGRQMVGLNANMQAALPHRDQRDGTAWMVEWMSLPQICMATARATGLAGDLSGRITARTDNMLAGIEDGSELIYAEALSFALARRMPRPEAQAAVKELCVQVQAMNAPLSRMAANRFPDHDFSALFTPQAQLGDAPVEADRFVAEARSL